MQAVFIFCKRLFSEVTVLSSWRFIFGEKKLYKASHQLSHEGKVQFVHCVPGRVIMRISIKGCVCDHYGLVSFIPEGGMIAQSHVGDKVPAPWNCKSDDRKAGVHFERAEK